MKILKIQKPIKFTFASKDECKRKESRLKELNLSYDKNSDTMLIVKPQEILKTESLSEALAFQTPYLLAKIPTIIAHDLEDEVDGEYSYYCLRTKNNRFYSVHRVKSFRYIVIPSDCTLEEITPEVYYKKLGKCVIDTPIYVTSKKYVKGSFKGVDGLFYAALKRTDNIPENCKEIYKYQFIKADELRKNKNNG